MIIFQKIMIFYDVISNYFYSVIALLKSQNSVTKHKNTDF